MVDPYAPPRAVLTQSTLEPQAPTPIRALILSGVIAAIIVIVFTAIGTLRMLGQPGAAVYIVFNLSLIAVILALAYGTARGSRTCAILALVTYSLLHAISSLSRGMQPGWPTYVLALLFLLGVAGTFRWHAWRAAQRSAGAA